MFFPLALLFTLNAPSALLGVLQSSSLAAGVVLCATLWAVQGMMLGRHDTQSMSSSFFYGLLTGMVLVLGHASLSAVAMSNAIAVPRLISSLLIGFIVMIGAHAAARQFTIISPKQLDRAARWSFNALTVTAILAASGLWKMHGGNFTVKPVGLFIEPSHFALAYSPVLLYRAATARPGWRRQVIVWSTFGLALWLENVTLVVIGLLIALIVLNLGRQILTLGVVAFGALFIDLHYFLARLVFSSETYNLTTLVFLSGWERAWLDLTTTHGLGVGFQQFGIVGPLGFFSERLVAIQGSVLNLLDGGSTASKLIGEFGVIGIMLLALYGRAFVSSVRQIRRDAGEHSPPDSANTRLFLHAFVATYSIELLVRGVGYFSPTGFLFVAALIGLHRLNRVADAVTAPTWNGLTFQRA